jgi:hypothetical protein
VRPGGSLNDVKVTTRQHAGHRVQLPWVVFHSEVEAEELADLLILWHGGEVLIRQEFQGEVVGADKEVMPPEIRAPMTHGLHKTDQLPLVGRELQVMSDESAGVEGERSSILMENSPKPSARGVTVDDE